MFFVHWRINSRHSLDVREHCRRDSQMTTWDWVKRWSTIALQNERRREREQSYVDISLAAGHVWSLHVMANLSVRLQCVSAAPRLWMSAKPVTSTIERISASPHRWRSTSLSKLSSESIASNDCIRCRRWHGALQFNYATQRVARYTLYSLY